MQYQVPEYFKSIQFQISTMNHFFSKSRMKKKQELPWPDFLPTKLPKLPKNTRVGCAIFSTTSQSELTWDKQKTLAFSYSSW